jgi:hypothetical protein
MMLALNRILTYCRPERSEGSPSLLDIDSTSYDLGFMFFSKKESGR